MMQENEDGENMNNGMIKSSYSSEIEIGRRASGEFEPMRRTSASDIVMHTSPMKVWDQVMSTTQEAAAKAKNAVKKNVSVFGAAPSLAQMKMMNDMSKGNKKIFIFASFWFRFRQYYPRIAPVSYLLGLALALSLWNTENGHMFIASFLSFLSCLAVICSYAMILPWRRHPSTIVLYRSATSLLFSFMIMIMALQNEVNPTGSTCDGFGVVVEFSVVAGECWLTTVALDLVNSLTNPFSSYKANMNKYHTYSWCFALLLSFILYNNPRCQAKFEGGICWVGSTSCLIGYYVFWIICMYLYQFGALLFAYLRLRKGLPVTFEIRSKIAMETFKCLASYALYLIFLMILFIILASGTSANGATSKNWSNFRKVFLFFVSSRGFVDGAIWFMEHEFAQDAKTVTVEEKEYEYDSPSPHAERSHSISRDRSGSNPVRFKAQSISFNVAEEVTFEDLEDPYPPRRRTSTFSSQNATPDLARKSAIHELADAITEIAEITAPSAQDFDEADLSPQVNLALRKQIVNYVTMGITQAASGNIAQLGTVMTNPIIKAFQSFRDSLTTFFFPKDPRLDDLQVTQFLLDGEHPFCSFASDIFKEIRAQEGISEPYYLDALQKTEREQLSEGASGAFMFFCGGGDFLVKTINCNEANVLHRSLKLYRDYLGQNSSSLLVRFLGSYSLKVYAQTFYFVVMRNIFEPGTDINERYDIKGSWINRSAAAPMPNKRVVCRHCNEMFTPAAKEKCGKIIGPHEANVVLKDNDLRTKISLKTKDAIPTLEIIKKDSDLLAQMGVLDYSLIVGVKKKDFEITDDEVVVRPASKAKGAAAGANNKKYVAFHAKSVTGNAIYYMGIVDFLQDWSLNKKIERVAKIYLQRSDPQGISVMEPGPYRDRFQNKMDEVFDIQYDERDSEASVHSRDSHSDRPSASSTAATMSKEQKANSHSTHNTIVPSFGAVATPPPPDRSKPVHVNKSLGIVFSPMDGQDTVVNALHTPQFSAPTSLPPLPPPPVPPIPHPNTAKLVEPDVTHEENDLFFSPVGVTPTRQRGYMGVINSEDEDEDKDDSSFL